MSTLNDLIQVEIETFRHSTRDINFDVYLKLSDENVTHVFSRSTGLDYQRLAQYIQKGVRHLYVRKDDEALYLEFVKRPARAIFEDPKTTLEKRIATLLNMTEQNISEVFAQLHVQNETVENSKAVVRSYVNLMTQSPQSLATVLKLVSHGEYLYYHSIAVSIFSMFIARASGHFNQRTLEIVGLGGFLHDIGSTQLPKEIVCSPQALTEEQWEEMKDHPKLGMKMLEGTKNISDEVRFIVYQHHEQPCAAGYPNGLNASSIYYPAKIVALADALSALISKRPFRTAYSIGDAIAIMYGEKGKYDPELLKIVASVFIPNESGLKKAA